MKKAGAVVLCLVFSGLVSSVFADKLEPSVEFVHEDAKGKLDMIGEVAIVMTGNDPFINRIMEDVLAISLLAKGVKIAYPEETNFGKPRRESGTDPMEIAKSVGANVLVTGMAVTEPPGEFQFRTVRISIASLSLIDVPQDKTLIWVLYEPEKATTSSKISRSFAEMMVKSLK
ncbi:hypothetical protein CH330_08465 [candidate division WOR-3 bacterium JGI_Cruoil_03_51_56]|uniref:Uncharacterized protein n=1 Tax=candidate division WOR-3 bacterium JGI_Cruoil_03_51_56 TaxID=1973747 RepID=A0A235BSG5_UNCW3|nr:MAG: hypothetical protein CH330_08465 [candidate division WOR-3 bacterium JGI_Cruoil_03_51_56]